jgi:hypothetical protein
MAVLSLLYIGTRYTRKHGYGSRSASSTSGVQASKATLNGAILGDECLMKYLTASAARKGHLTHLTNDVTWQFSLGMHLFRKALREYSKGVLVSRSKKSNSSSTVLNTDKVKVKSSVKKYVAENQRNLRNERPHGRQGSRAPPIRNGSGSLLYQSSRPVEPRRLLVELPLKHPKRAAVRRRCKRRPMVDLGKSRTAPYKALLVENPVKVADAELEDSKPPISLFARHMESYWGLGENWVASISPEDYIRQEKRIKERNKVPYLRHGANRYEKRRNWFADRVVKDIPESLRRKYGKAKVGGVLHYLMKGRKPFGSEAVVRLLTEEDRNYESELNPVKTGPRWVGYSKVVDSFHLDVVSNRRITNYKYLGPHYKEKRLVAGKMVRNLKRVKGVSWGPGRLAHAQQLRRFGSHD